MMASEINSVTQNEVTLPLTGHNLNKSPIKILQNSVNLFAFKSYVEFPLGQDVGPNPTL